MPTEQGYRVAWDDYPLKHYVRYRGWLPACEHRWRLVDAQVRSRGNARTVPLKYFTFCAADAVDVFMLVQAGVIPEAVRSRGFETVYFCEEDELEYERIVSLIGQNGFQGKFQDIVLFEDDELTLANNLDQGKPPREIRQRLEAKEAHERLVASFPFDVINLDMCGPFFPPRAGAISPMVEIVRRLLQWQQLGDGSDGHTIDEFTLIVTTHVSQEHSNGEAINQLQQRLDTNIDEHAEFRAAYGARYNGTTPATLREQSFAEFFAISLPKVLVREAVEANWSPSYRGVFLYEPDDQRQATRYQMMSSVTHFERITAQAGRRDLFQTTFEQKTAAYVEATSAVVTYGTTDCNAEMSTEATRMEVEANLGQVLDCRRRYEESAEE